MATFLLLHGAGDRGWAWHLVERELRSRGHHTVAPDLPADDDTLTLTDYRDAAIAALDPIREPTGDGHGNPARLAVVGQSFGAFTAPLVADALGADLLVLVAGMVPAPGEPPDDWWADVGYAAAADTAAAADGGLTGNDDPLVSFYADVPRELAEEAVAKGERAHPSPAAGAQPWPLKAWPDVPTASVVCAQDHFLPPDLQRRLARERLGVEPVEIDGGHCVTLSRPVELAAQLEQLLPPPRTGRQPGT